MKQPDSAPSLWWGEHQLEVNDIRHWSVGACSFAVQRLAKEWRLGHRNLEDEHSGTPVLGQPVDHFPETIEQWSRHLYTATRPAISITPRTLDRAMISRPVKPFQIQPHQETTIYISSPLHVAIQTPEDNAPLVEFPTLQLSDTWFGPSTLEGELCYAAKTHARTDLDALPRQSHRATSEIRIVNRSKKPLRVEKLSLPLPYLGLYQIGHEIWTNRLSLTAESDEHFAKLDIEPEPPGNGTAMELGKARLQAERGILVRALNGLFS